MAFRLFTLVLMFTAFSASAASAVEALRATASSARSRVTQLRAEQMTKRNELSVVSSRIEALKAKREAGLFGSSDLDAALKQSQSLSAELSVLAQRMSVTESDFVASNAALLEAVNRELTVLRAQFDAANDRATRSALIAKLKSLRAERDAIRAALPASQVPALEALKASDDPDELFEQAELLRDHEEKLARELKAIEARLVERHDEAELDQRVQRFFGEESMFDDQDRRLRVQLRQTTGENTPRGAQSDFGAPSAGPAGGGAPSGAEAANSLDPSSFRISSATDARPQIGGSPPAALSREFDDVKALDAQRAALKKLLDETKAKAAALETRARQLE